MRKPLCLRNIKAEEWAHLSLFLQPDEDKSITLLDDKQGRGKGAFTCSPEERHHCAHTHTARVGRVGGTFTPFP